MTPKTGAVVADFLEVWNGPERRLVPLEGDRATLGRASSSDIVLASDEIVSRLHSVFELLGSRWSVRDLGSSNGTFVNGERIWSGRALRGDDEIIVGETRLVYRQQHAVPEGSTRFKSRGRVPELTRRERDVLVALCRPVLAASVFTEPASSKEVAAELVVTEAAVRQHLLKLYEKFGVDEMGERRRLRLANEAIARGVVTRFDLQRKPT